MASSEAARLRIENDRLRSENTRLQSIVAAQSLLLARLADGTLPIESLRLTSQLSADEPPLPTDALKPDVRQPATAGPLPLPTLPPPSVSLKDVGANGLAAGEGTSTADTVLSGTSTAVPPSVTLPEPDAPKVVVAGEGSSTTPAVASAPSSQPNPQTPPRVSNAGTSGKPGEWTPSTIASSITQQASPDSPGRSTRRKDPKNSAWRSSVLFPANWGPKPPGPSATGGSPAGSSTLARPSTSAASVSTPEDKKPRKEPTSLGGIASLLRLGPRRGQSADRLATTGGSRVESKASSRKASGTDVSGDGKPTLTPAVGAKDTSPSILDSLPPSPLAPSNSLRPNPTQSTPSFQSVTPVTEPLRRPASSADLLDEDRPRRKRDTTADKVKRMSWAAMSAPLSLVRALADGAGPSSPVAPVVPVEKGSRGSVDKGSRTSLDVRDEGRGSAGKEQKEKDKKEKRRSMFFDVRSTSSQPSQPSTLGSHPPLNTPAAAPVRIFSVPLSSSVACSSITRSGLTVPAVIARCVDYIEARGIEEEGVYRQSGSVTAVTALRTKFEIEGDVDLLVDKETYLDPHAAASLLKLFLRLLPNPLVPRTGWDVQSASKEAKDLVAFLVMHLDRVVAKSARNKMTRRNLLVVFAPTVGGGGWWGNEGGDVNGGAEKAYGAAGGRAMAGQTGRARPMSMSLEALESIGAGELKSLKGADEDVGAVGAGVSLPAPESNKGSSEVA